jgi:hypothetical protein
MMQAADGPRELSMGYVASVDFSDGVTPDGEPYDAIMSEFRMNHVAVVPLARGGKELRIGDGADARWGASPYNDRKDTIMADAINTRTVLIDGLSVVTTDAGAQALEKLQGQITDAAKVLTDAETAHAKAITDADAKLAKAEAALDAEKAKVLSDADLDKRVADRADLLAVAKGIAPDVKTAGLGDAAIRKAVVTAKLGDAVEGKSDAYIDARFDILAEADPFADSLKSGVKTTNDADPAGTAYASNVASMADAWKSGPNAKKEA